MKIVSGLSLFSMLFFCLVGSTVVLAEHHSGQIQQANSSPHVEVNILKTKAVMRDLWIGHAFWVRAVVSETFNNNMSAAQAAESEAVENAKQLASAMNTFYGEVASEHLFDLLAGHYTAVKSYMSASRSKDLSKQKSAMSNMSENAEEIATFLSDANPHLPKDTLLTMLIAHGGHHVEQIHAFAGKKYSEEAKVWDAMKSHMYGVADALTQGIAKQFPEKFN